MASNNENVNGEFVIEYVVDQDVVDLLKSFNLSDNVIDLFVENSFELDDLKHIERDELEALLPSPFLAERARCIRGLNEWRLSQNLPPVTRPLEPHVRQTENLRNQQPCIVPLISRPRDEWTSRLLIERSRRGREILETYAFNTILTKRDRIFITHLLIDEFIDEYGKLTREELAKRSSELKVIFPTVEEFVWYRPTFIRDQTGKKIKLGRLAKGCLFDRNNNYQSKHVNRRDCGESSLHRTGEESLNSANDSESIFTEEAVAAYHETKIWFKHHQDEWEEVKIRWSASSSIRLHEIRQISEPTFGQILDEYPILRRNDGYQLIKLDFNLLHEHSQDLLFNRFGGFRSRAPTVYKTGVGEQAKPLLALFQDQLSEDAYDCIAVLLLVHLWPSPLLRMPNGRKWKPSLKESCEGIVLHLKTLADYEGELARLSKQSLQRGLSDHPRVVVVGGSLKDIKLIFVNYKDISYRVETFLKSLDITFKIFKTYNIPFPRETVAPWSFIAHYFYDFEPSNENPSKAQIISLTTTLRNLPEPPPEPQPEPTAEP